MPTFTPPPKPPPRPATPYEKLQALAEEAKGDRRLQHIFQHGDQDDKEAELKARGFTLDDINTLREDARALTGVTLGKPPGYWLW